MTVCSMVVKGGVPRASTQDQEWSGESVCVREELGIEEYVQRMHQTM